MAVDIYDDILIELGFGRIGQLDFRLRLQVWWHAEAKIQVIIFPLGSKTLIKGCKDYYLKSITEQGETWARDIGPLQDYLEAHFQEVHLSFSFFRDIPPQLATTQIRRKMKADAPAKSIPDTGEIAKLQRQLDYQRRQLQSTQDLIGLDSGSSELIRGWMNHDVEHRRRSIQVTQDQLQQQQEQVSLFRNLQKEYERKGTAVTLVFSISSNIQSVSSPTAFRDAVCGVVKELTDLHRYQVSQKLSGGKLNIQVAEAQEPVLVWIEEWFGGALSPRQLAKLGSEFDVLRQAMQEHTSVVPREDIRIDDVNKDDRKLLAGRIVSTLVRRLDKPHTGLDLTDLPDNALPAKIGLTMRESAVTGHPAIIPLSRLDNMYISGATGVEC